MAVRRYGLAGLVGDGAVDAFGLDDGRNKIGRYVHADRDSDTVAGLVAKLADRPAKLTVAQLVGPHVVGAKSGFRSDEYAAAIKATDRLVGRIQDAIADSPRLDGHTLLVVTANRGGTGRQVKGTKVRSVYKIPLLVVVANNRSFFNDELHQERVARMRNRPVENRWVGQRISEPDIDLASMARAQGAQGFGPVTQIGDLAATFAKAIAAVEAGEVAVVDVRVEPGYTAATTAAMTRKSD